MNNKDRASEFIDYLWNNGDESVLGTYLAADFKMHRPLTDRYGCDREAFRKWFRYVVNFSPDIRFTPNDIYESGDTVIVSWRAKGTHQGEFLGIPASGKKYTTEGVFIFKFRDGKLIYSRIEWDVLSFLNKIGYLEGGEFRSNINKAA